MTTIMQMAIALTTASFSPSKDGEKVPVHPPQLQRSCCGGRAGG